MEEKKTEKVRKRIRVIYSSSEEEETENSSEIAPSDSSSLTDANASHSNEPSTSGAVSQNSDNNEDSQSEEEGTDDTEWNRPAKLTQSMTKKSKNYWLRRYEYFKKYDEGIKLDEESWFSVTPESIASLIASRCKTDGIIIDAFCGCGGNTIKFAKNCFKVIAIDIDPIKIAYARHNATIYGVQDKIEFIEGDYLKLAPYLKGDVVFLSPPWGGINYYKAKVFNIETMIPMNGIKVFELTQNITKDIAYFLPRNIDMNQLVKLAGPGHSIEIQKHVDGARTKVITAYYGDLIQSDNVNESDCVVDVYASDDGSDS